MQLFYSNGLDFSCSCLLPLLLLTVVKSDREHVEHGFSGKFKKEHSAESDQHNIHADHKVVIGSRKEAEIFDDLSPEEAKRRLAVLAKKMDKDDDGYVIREELERVIKHTMSLKKFVGYIICLRNMISLDLEESNDRFREMDTNQDNLVTWDEYVQESFGDIDPENEIMDADDKRLLEDDRKFFSTADQDKDDKLSNAEFHAFQNPESFPHMHAALIEVTMKEKDKNHDGKITLDEFLDDLAGDQKSDWYMVEKNRFEYDYDKDRNGVLEGAEIASWLVMNLETTAAEEVEHLMSKADKDNDGRLSIDEIISESDLFVGSEATNHGENLVDLLHDEL
uniref:Reticulocalbin-3 n=1 Tax=Brugia timori TaxID=42155 RepID=A0A0R3QUB2_9BILA